MRISKTNFFYLTFCLIASVLMLACSFFALTPAKSFAAVEVDPETQLASEAVGHDNQPLQKNQTADVDALLPGEETVTTKLQQYDWSKVKNFDVTFDLSKVAEGEYSSFTYTYTAHWTPALVQDGLEEKKQATFNADYSNHEELVTATTVSTKDEIATNVKLGVDGIVVANGKSANVLFGDDYEDRGGWGVYLFELKINETNQTFYSDVFELAPVKLDASNVDFVDPTIVSVQEYSTQGLTTAYSFSLEGQDGDSEKYNYIDRKLITWYVEGKAEDGRNFVLTPSDIPEGSSVNSIYKTNSVERVGPTFKFDPPNPDGNGGLEGTWTVKVVILQSDGVTVYTSATTNPISTVKGLSTQSIIWIVVAAAVVAAIIVAVVIIVTIKRERVY